MGAGIRGRYNVQMGTLNMIWMKGNWRVGNAAATAQRAREMPNAFMMLMGWRVWWRRAREELVKSGLGYVTI
jgi:hypothetical protein